MNQAKVFSILVSIAALGYAALSFYFLPLATFQGDLTRMGLLPESQFGWALPQPALAPALLQQAAMHEADVLVIGDSFSEDLVWQSVLTRHGLKVRTEHWVSMRGICSDLMPWLRLQGFAGKFLILESAERSLSGNLNNSFDCQQTRYRQRPQTDAPRQPPAVSFDPAYGNYAGKLSTGIRTRLNMLKYARMSRKADFHTWLLPNGVKMARVANGCELFSHASCNDALFLTEDKAAEVDDNALTLMQTLNSRLSGITPIWVVVPNKTTAYLHPDKQFWNAAERHLLAPNLLRMSRQAIQNKTVDLYPANNTHYSTTGYLLMGEEIYKTMQQAQAGKAPGRPPANKRQ